MGATMASDGGFQGLRRMEAARESGVMKRRHWIKTTGAALAGLIAGARLQGQGAGRDARQREGSAPGGERPQRREERRFVHGFETELMR